MSGGGLGRRGTFQIQPQRPVADSLNNDLARQVAESIGSDATALQPFMIELKTTTMVSSILNGLVAYQF